MFNSFLYVYQRVSPFRMLHMPDMDSGLHTEYAILAPHPSWPTNPIKGRIADGHGKIEATKRSPSLCIYICIYIYMCVCVCICIYICVCIYIYTPSMALTSPDCNSLAVMTPRILQRSDNWLLL